MQPCLTLSIIRYVSRVKWTNLEKEIASFPTPPCRSLWKYSLRVTLDYGRQLYFNYLFIWDKENDIDKINKTDSCNKNITW